MTEKSEVEQTHCVVQKVFAFSVPPLGSAEGFKASLWPKQPIWVGRLRVVSRNDKCAVLLEHTEKEGLFASCPIQNAQTVESAIDSSRYFVLRLSDGKGRHALIGIGFNDRAQAFDFKVALQDWQNHNQEGGPAPGSTLPESTSNYSIPQGGSIHVTFGGGGAKKKRDSSGPDVSTALAGMKLDAPPAKGAASGAGETEKEKKKKKKREKEAAAAAAEAGGFGNLSAAQSVVGSSSGFAAPAASSSSSSASSSANIIDFGFGDFDPLSTPKQQQSGGNNLSLPQGDGPRRASVQSDPFAADSAPAFGATPFDTPFDDTPNDWVKF